MSDALITLTLTRGELAVLACVLLLPLDEWTQHTQADEDSLVAKVRALHAERAAREARP